MKVLFKFTVSIIVLAFFTACVNPFWPVERIGSEEEPDPKAPVITIQPISWNYPKDYPAYLQGADGTPLSVDASVSDNGTLTYQWYEVLAANSYNNAIIIDGATNKTYQPPTEQDDVTLYYFVEVTNTLFNGKTEKTRSNIVTVKVHTPQIPNIEMQPVGGEYSIGQAAYTYVFATKEDNGILSYQWYSNTTPSNSGGTILAGRTNAFLQLDTTAANTFYYYVEVKNTWDIYNQTINSDVATVIVKDTTITEPQVIPVVSVNVTSPVLGAEPINDATPAGQFYNVETVSWSPIHPFFLGSTLYTVTVKVKADSNYTFGNTELINLQANVNGMAAVNGALEASNTEFTFSYEFDQTPVKSIASIKIGAQPNKLTYNHLDPNDILDLNGLEIILVYNDKSELSGQTLAQLLSDNHPVTTEPAVGAQLSIPLNNNNPIVITYEGLTPINTNNFTINPRPIPNAFIYGITAPSTGQTPVATASSTSTFFSVGNVTWSPSHSTFQGNEVYTASVILTAAEYYTFTGGLLSAASATIDSVNATVADNTGATVKLSRTFAETDPRIITGMAFKAGSNNPTKLVYRHNETLDLTGLIVVLTYNAGPEQEVTAANFGTYSITTNPPSGTTMLIGTHNGISIEISCGELPKLNTGTLTVNKALPTVNWPTPYTANLGDTLGADALTPPASNGSGTDGSFEWKESLSTLVGNVGVRNHYMVFTPNDGTIYEIIESSIQVTVKGGRTIGITYNPVTDELNFWDPGIAEYDDLTKAYVVQRGDGINLELDESFTYDSIKWTMTPNPGGIGIDDQRTFTYTFNDGDYGYNANEVYVISLVVWIENTGGVLVPFNRTIRIKVAIQ